ncbi:YacL family protein [Tolumonas lignilytica]|uniref:YacL family protein n=1 Tax=Tolumonas lignilytica TaxID=1283284 RepID=UPI0004656B07|nr:YacL family protein [Tolumonas lignilytica]
MDHEFVRDIEGRCLARLSMGHEAFGFWLTDELGVDISQCNELLKTTARLLHGGDDFKLSGKTFCLYLDQDSATVSALELQFETEIEDNELGLSYYDDELFAACGLDDFEQLLLAWRDFITEK